MCGLLKGSDLVFRDPFSQTLFSCEPVRVTFMRDGHLLWEGEERERGERGGEKRERGGGRGKERGEGEREGGEGEREGGEGK